MSNSKLKFLSGTPSHTPAIPTKKKSETIFDSPLRVNSEEYEHFEKTDGTKGQLQMEHLETDLNARYQIDEELEDESQLQITSLEVPTFLAFHNVHETLPI